MRLNRFTFELTTTTTDDRPVYITGNFNNWKTADANFRMTPQGNNQYKLELVLPEKTPGVLVYKYVRGGWENEELDAYGTTMDNRTVELHRGRVSDYVPCWLNNGLACNPDFMPQIQILDENFEIPQLIKTRRISVLLPYNYHQTEISYPVLYLQDGQNLLDPNAPFGSWGVDRKLAFMAEQGQGDIIIVAIDHAVDERIAEFTPSHPTKLGIGDGKKYTRFLADTLKPYIDKHFRTLPERMHTGIGGSSMGGLISIYAGLMYPEVYSKILVFSPSLWVDPQLHDHAPAFLHPDNDISMYLYGGGRESADLVQEMWAFKENIESQGIHKNITFQISIDPKGKHNEYRWGEEFPKAVEWLFFR